MRGKKMTLLNEVDERSADELQQIFGIKSKEEVDEILRKTARFQGVAKQLGAR